MWDFSALSQLLETCGDVGLCGNPSNVVETTSEKSKNSASRYSFDEHDDTETGNGKSKIGNLGIHAKEDDDINRKHYKRGRSYTPSQRNRPKEEEDDDDDIQHRSFSASDREARDDFNRRRTRSTSLSLVEKKSKAKEKVTSTKKAFHRKNSNRDCALPPLKPRTDT